jgi:hypothetical protein
MAKIPTYTSRAAAASTSGIPRASGIPFRDFASPGIIEAGKQIGAIADQLLKSAEDDAVGQATLNATLKFNDLQMELQTMDPMQAISSFDDRANAILEEAGGGLSSNAASRFRNAMRREFASKKIAVQKDGITRGRQKLEANLVSRMAGLASSAQATDNDTIYQQRADEARQAIDEAIANRVIAADVGERYYQNYLKDADSARASFDMQKDPDNFVENIKSGEYLPSLTGEQRATLQKQGNEILERRARKAETERKAAETKVIKNADTALKVVVAGGDYNKVAQDLDPDMLRMNIQDQDEAERIIELTQDAVAGAEIQNDLHNRSGAEITDILSTSKGDIDANVSPELQLQNLEQDKRLRAAAAKVLKARQEDAGREALRNDAVKETYQDFRRAFMSGDTEAAGVMYRNYAFARDAEYDRLGINPEDRRLLPNSMAEEEADLFKSGNVTPEEAGERMKMLRQTMGDDWPMALNEMQKFKMPRSAAKLMMVDDDNIRTRMIRGDRDGGVSEVTKRYGIKENDFNKIIAQTTQKFITAADKVGFAMAGGIQDAVKSVAVDMMVYGKESSPQAAIKEAYDLVVTKQYAVVNENKLRGIVPKENYGDRSSIRLDAGLNHWFKENSDFVFHKNNQKEFLPGVTSDDAQKIMLDLVQQNGMWQLTPDGSAAELHVNGSRAFDAEGRAVRVSLDEAINLYDRALDARRSTPTGSRRMGGQDQ